jgi:hypothetical protein
MRLMGHVLHMGDIRNEKKIFARNHSDVLGVDERIILK